MNAIRSRVLSALVVSGLAAAEGAPGGAAWAAQQETPRIRVLIVDGQNNHNWRATTPVIREILEQSGRFAVDVASVPSGKQNAAAREAFSPPLDRYQVVVSNFSDFGGPAAPKVFMQKLTGWVAEGGGFVAVHAATAGLQAFPDYCRMIGLGWGGPQRGHRLTVDASGKIVRTPQGQGRGTGHGPHGPIDVTTWAADHPITRGMPKRWRVAHDELWFSVRGPAQRLTVLATGYSPQTKQNEPILWTVGHGRGRVLVTLLGHDPKAMQDAGFRTTLLRGSQWAATGRCTVPLQGAAAGGPSGHDRRRKEE